MVSENKKIKVLIVDDLNVVVMAVSSIINNQPDMEAYASASDPYEAVRIIGREKPDVILLDIQMPRMDGLTFLHKIMTQHPVPVVMFSSVAEGGSANAIKALQMGAISILPKPKNIISNFDFHQELVMALRDAFAVTDKLSKLIYRGKGIFNNNPDSRTDKRGGNSAEVPSKMIIAIGASTGGTQAIHHFLSQLPSNIPGILIVQHMPGNFTRWFAESLDRTTGLKVYEAKPGMVVHNGTVVIANGFYHMEVKKGKDCFVITTKDGPTVNRHKPSVDVLFDSVAKNAGINSLGILLTGMGDDGALGLKKIRNAGAVTIAQDEASSVVFGMPRAAISINAASKVMNLKEIAHYIKNNLQV